MDRTRVIERALDLSEDQLSALPQVHYRTNIATRMSRLLLDGVCLLDGCGQPYRGRSVYCEEHSAQGGIQDKSARAFVHAVFAWMAKVPVRTRGLKASYLNRILLEHGRYVAARTARLQMRLDEVASASRREKQPDDEQPVAGEREVTLPDVVADGEVAIIERSVGYAVTIILSVGMDLQESRYVLADGSVYELRVRRVKDDKPRRHRVHGAAPAES